MFELEMCIPPFFYFSFFFFSCIKSTENHPLDTHTHTHFNIKMSLGLLSFPIESFLCYSLGVSQVSALVVIGHISISILLRIIVTRKMKIVVFVFYYVHSSFSIIIFLPLLQINMATSWKKWPTGEEHWAMRDESWVLVLVTWRTQLMNSVDTCFWLSVFLSAKSRDHKLKCL